MLYHPASHLSTLRERESEESESEEGDESELEPLAKTRRQRHLQEVGVMHQVSYCSSVSTFCRNEIKDRNYKTVQQHIFISFPFSGQR